MKAHELLRDPRRFTTGALARDKDGKSCGTAAGSGAVAFDALGAIFWCYPDGGHHRTDVRTGKTPCQRARELSLARYGVQLGKLNWEQAVEILRDANV